MESSPSPCKLDHGGLEPNAVAIYEEVMYRMLPLIHSSQYVCKYACMYVRMHVCIYMYVCTYVCMQVCIYVLVHFIYGWIDSCMHISG